MVIQYDARLRKHDTFDYPSKDGYCTQNKVTWSSEGGFNSVTTSEGTKTLFVHDIAFIERNGERLRYRGWIDWKDEKRWAWSGTRGDGSPNSAMWYVGDTVE